MGAYRNLIYTCCKNVAFIATTVINKCAIVMQGAVDETLSQWFCRITAQSELLPSSQSGVYAPHTSCVGFN
mgnify:CR=1 FL=1